MIHGRVVTPGAGRSILSRIFPILLALAISVAGVACTKEKEEVETPTTTTSLATSGGVLRLGVVGPVSADPAFLNPADQGSLMLSDLLFDGLTSMDPVTNEVKPALATSWEHDGTATRWAFALREDAKFSDGAPVTAADVKASFERLANQGNSSLAGVRLELISGYAELSRDEAVTTLSGIEVVDEGHFFITLTQPFAEFPEFVSIPELGVLPNGTPGVGEDGEPRIPSVTSGPFKVADNSDSKVTLEKSVASQALLDGVEVTEFEDAGAAYRAFLDDKVDWAPVSTADREGAKKEVDGYLETPLDVELWFGFNLAKAGLDNQRMREALVRAVDRQRIVDDVLSGRLGLNGTVVKGIPGALDDACGDICKHDPEAAKAIVAELYPDGNVPTIEIEHYDDAVQKAIVDALVADLNAVGIPTTVKNLPFNEYREFVASGEASVFSFGWVGIVPIADSYLGPLFLSQSADNVVGFVDPSFDQMIRDARATLDSTERQRKYQDIERDAMSRVPLLPLAQFTAPQVLDADHVKGWNLRLNGTFDTEAVWVVS